MKEPQTGPHWIYIAEAESPEALGQVGAEKGGAGHLKKYIYTVHVHPSEASCVGENSVSRGHGARQASSSLDQPPCRACWFGQHGHRSWPSSSGEGGEVKNSIYTLSGQREEAWGWPPLG